MKDASPLAAILYAKLLAVAACEGKQPKLPLTKLPDGELLVSEHVIVMAREAVNAYSRYLPAAGVAAAQCCQQLPTAAGRFATTAGVLSPSQK